MVQDGSSRLPLSWVFVSACLIFSFSGCSYEDPVGGYNSGVWTTPEQRSYAVAYFKDLELPKNIKTYEVTLYRILGSAAAHPIKLSYSKTEQSMKLDFKEVSPKTITLQVTEKTKEKVCGAGGDPGRVVKVCYGNDEINLSVHNEVGAILHRIALKRDVKFRQPLTPELSLDDAMGQALFQ